MKARYYPRAVVHATALFTVDGLMGEGQVLNLTVPGCLIDSPLSPKKGDALTLRLRLPKPEDTFHVALGIVRWVQGSRFGVEFIQMDQKERVRYNALVRRLLKQQATSHSRLEQTRYSQQPGGVNWHLEEHGLSRPTSSSCSHVSAGRRIR